MTPPDPQKHPSVRRAIRCRLYPTPEQEAVLERHCSDARFVWNLLLEQFNLWRRGGPNGPTSKERSKQLVELRQEHECLREGSSTVQHLARRDFEQACKNYWAHTHRRPTWRRWDRNMGFGCQATILRRVSRKWATLRIPKVGEVRLRVSGAFPLVAMTSITRVARDSKGRWHARFSVQVPVEAREPIGSKVGIDMGIKSTITTSDGQMLRAPSMSRHNAHKLVRLQQQLERQQKGSARRERTKRQIAALHQQQKDRRKNWTEIQTTKLIRAQDLIAVEKLPVANMVRRPKPKPNPEKPGEFLPNGAAAKTGLNRRIGQQGWSEFRQRLEDKAETSGIRVVAVPPHNTSRECNACGHVAKENRKSQAVFRCVSCGHTAHADRNAAENVLARALALAPTPGSGARDSVPARRSRASAARTSRRGQANA